MISISNDCFCYTRCKVLAIHGPGNDRETQHSTGPALRKSSLLVPVSVVAGYIPGSPVAWSRALNGVGTPRCIYSPYWRLPDGTTVTLYALCMLQSLETFMAWTGYHDAVGTEQSRPRAASIGLVVDVVSLLCLIMVKLKTTQGL